MRWGRKPYPASSYSTETTDGHTAKVAAKVGQVLRTIGADVDVVEAGTTDALPEKYARVIVAVVPIVGGKGTAEGNAERADRLSNRHSLVDFSRP